VSERRAQGRNIGIGGLLMPKTNDKDAYYFSHDCNARNDPKILALRSVYGLEGYAIYFMLIEILREQPDYRLPINKYIWNTLAMQMQCSPDRVQEIINACCTEFEEDGNTLLVNDGKYLYSESLIRRMEKMERISKARQEAAQKRWKKDDKSNSDANAEQEQNNCNLKEKKRNENKRNENKRKESKGVNIDIFASFAGDNLPLLQALNDFEAMRKKIKKPMTDRAKELLIGKLQKLSGGNPDLMIRILNQSILNCWQGIFELKDNGRYSGRTSVSDKMNDLRTLHQIFSEEEKVR